MTRFKCGAAVKAFRSPANGRFLIVGLGRLTPNWNSVCGRASNASTLSIRNRRPIGPVHHYITLPQIFKERERAVGSD